MSPRIGVLALQGAVEPHQRALVALGATTRQVRTATDLAGVDALVIPGGESTTMSKLLAQSDLGVALGERLAVGMPAMGTCAGMILLAAEVADGRADQHSYGVIDLSVRRNAFGRQQDSFETDLDVHGFDTPFHAVFIRAPRVERIGDGVETLADLDGEAVLCRNETVLVSTFHPELTTDPRIHERFLEMVR